MANIISMHNTIEYAEYGTFIRVDTS